MNRALISVGILLTLSQAATAMDRSAAVDMLVSEYETVEKEFFDAPRPKEPTNADDIRRYEAWPGWSYIPRFLEVAEAVPGDEAAFRCCQWIIDRTDNVGNDDKQIFDAEQRAWDILSARHSGRAELPMLCLRAVSRDGPAQDRFLRALLKREDMSHENLGIATVALAESGLRKM
jgi:hypothetical protein